MTDPTFGRLRRLDPRQAWPHEALNFTPWLAEHIEHLGELLGMELEVEEREAKVGEFSLDILARDLGSDRCVAIENQLEATDHLHLGQLITYAAGVEADVVIWISRHIREEHRQALDWLNRGHEGATEYFGVVVELLQIDDSHPAPNFRLVASPNDWSRKPSRGSGSGEVTGKRLLYRDYFQELIDELREEHRFTNAKAGQPQNWYSFTSGTRGFSYGANFAWDERVRVELYIDLQDGGANDAAFAALQEGKDEIEAAFGEQLSWEQLEGKRACRIATYTDGSIEDPVDQLAAHKSWMIDRLLRLRSVFGPHLRDASDHGQRARPTVEA